MRIFDGELINTFDWEDLDGKDIRICVQTDESVISVFGLDKWDDKTYLLHQQEKNNREDDSQYE